MKIYTANTLTNTKRILDPDNQDKVYQTNNYLHSYFKQLTIPQSVIYIIGIYIEFEIDQLLYEDNQLLYQNISKKILEVIQSHLDIGNAELLNMNSNFFFITMFDVLEDTLVLACLDLYKNLTSHTLYEHKINIHTGIYFSNTDIQAYQFFEMSKEQFENTLTHDQSLISVKYLSSIK
ncbi:MAG: hypothetical protein RR585_07690 [Coprobacillus sp.]